MDTQESLTLVPTETSRGDDYYIEVAQQRAGYIYRAVDATWTVGVMTRLGDGDIGPFAQGLPSQVSALDFARSHQPR